VDRWSALAAGVRISRNLGGTRLFCGEVSLNGRDERRRDERCHRLMLTKPSGSTAAEARRNRPLPRPASPDPSANVKAIPCTMKHDRPPARGPGACYTPPIALSARAGGTTQGRTCWHKLSDVGGDGR
jgi:hypothetical protein